MQTSVTNAKGKTTSYSYNSLNDRLASVTAAGKTVAYEYDTVGALKKITAPGGTVYNFAYDEFGRSTDISVGSQLLSRTQYKNNYSSLVSKFTYGNGAYKEYTYDNQNRLIAESLNGTQSIKYAYDSRGNTYKITDLLSNVTTQLAYDLIGRVTGIESSDGQKAAYSYDNLNRIAKSVWKKGDISLSTSYIYGDNAVSGQKTGLIYGVKLNNVQKLAYEYDELSRLNKRTLSTTTPFVTEYTYHDGAAPNTTTTLVKTVKNGDNVLRYEYDELGNITDVYKNGVLIENYSYDDLNQLVSAYYGEYTYNYEYDNGGNIKRVLRNNTEYRTYSYDSGEWKDRLTNYNGYDITYDELGNPINYRLGAVMTWQNGRQLAGYTVQGHTISYTYDASGQRTSRTYDGVRTDYYWMNGVLQAQKRGDDYSIFLYDESGNRYGLIHKNGTIENYYYYVYNVQGDVIALLDAAGNTVAEYGYDAWGRITAYTGTEEMAWINPFMYRGYYYDSGIELYYLGTRYYDSQTGRFLNADGQLNADAFLGCNMYAYCYNNPVMLSDSAGNRPIDSLSVISETRKQKDRSFGYMRELSQKKKTITSTSDEGTAFISEYEEFFDVPYDDGYGNITIGFGHLIKSNEQFSKITKEEALNILKNDLLEAEKRVVSYSERKGIVWDQAQFDALVSLSYNSGYNVNRVIDALCAGKDPYDAFTMIIYSNGNKSLGLYRRRMDEADIYTKGIYQRTYRSW